MSSPRLTVSNRCDRCRVKYRQNGRLCRSCSRIEGEQQISSFERDRDRLERRDRKIAALRGPVVLDGPKRVVVIHGQAFEVQFDGT